MKLFKLIASDLRAKAQWLHGSQTWKAIVKTLAADGSPTMVLYRLMQASQKARLGPLTLILNKLIAVFCNCVIGRNADFGHSFVILYSNGILINSGVVGGSHVTLAHQITIGEHFPDSAKRGKHRAPILGDYVYVGAGVRIIGSVKIGNHTKIGANSVVVGDVPDGASMFGVPAQIVWQQAGPQTQIEKHGKT